MVKTLGFHKKSWGHMNFIFFYNFQKKSHCQTNYLNLLLSNKKYVSKHGPAENATNVEETWHEDG